MTRERIGHILSILALAGFVVLFSVLARAQTPVIGLAGSPWGKVAITANGGTKSLDLDKATFFDITASAATTLSPANGKDGQMFSVRVCQDGSGGHAITWGAMVFGTPVPTAIASACDLFFLSRATNGSYWSIGLPNTVALNAPQLSAVPWAGAIIYGTPAMTAVQETTGIKLTYPGSTTNNPTGGTAGDTLWNEGSWIKPTNGADFQVWNAANFTVTATFQMDTAFTSSGTQFAGILLTPTSYNNFDRHCGVGYKDGTFSWLRIYSIGTFGHSDSTATTGLAISTNKTLFVRLRSTYLTDGKITCEGSADGLNWVEIIKDNLDNWMGGSLKVGPALTSNNKAGIVMHLQQWSISQP